MISVTGCRSYFQVFIFQISSVVMQLKCDKMSWLLAEACSQSEVGFMGRNSSAWDRNNHFRSHFLSFLYNERKWLLVIHLYLCQDPFLDLTMMPVHHYENLYLMKLGPVANLWLFLQKHFRNIKQEVREEPRGTSEELQLWSMFMIPKKRTTAEQKEHKILSQGCQKANTPLYNKKNHTNSHTQWWWSDGLEVLCCIRRTPTHELLIKARTQFNYSAGQWSKTHDRVHLQMTRTKDKTEVVEGPDWLKDCRKTQTGTSSTPALLNSNSLWRRVGRNPFTEM